MEVEKNVTGHEATPAAPSASPIPAGPATTVSENHAKPDTTVQQDAYKPHHRMTPESIKERVAKFKKGPEKAPKPAENPPGAPDPKAAPAAPKAPEKVAPEAGKQAQAAPKEGEPPPVATPGAEYKAPTTFKALQKEYELPKWAQKACENPELEKEIVPMFSKVMAFDHVQARLKEQGDRFTELSGSHEEVVGGIKELRSIYSDAVSSGNLLGLDDFFGKLQIPPNVILQYALQRVKFDELPPEQQHIVLGQLQAKREARDLSVKTQTLEGSQAQATSKILGLEMNNALTRPDVAPLVSQFDSAPGRKPGDFFEAVRRHGELHWYQTKQVLHPAEAVKQVLSMYGLTGAPAQPAPAQPGTAAPAATAQPGTPAPAPQSAPPALPAPGVAVVPAAHRNVSTIPGVTGTSGSPTASKPKTVEDLKRIRKERFG